jgi:hypothetical protein
VLDHVRFTLAHEIDDPDAISAVPYTLTQARLSLDRSVTRETSVQIFAEGDHAAYLDSADRETSTVRGRHGPGNSTVSWR